MKEKAETKIDQPKELNIWQMATAVLAVLLVLVLFWGITKPGQASTDSTAQTTPGNANSGTPGQGASITAQQAADKTLKYINDYLMQGAGTATLTGVSESTQFYDVKVGVNGQAVDIYVTKDGKYFVPKNYVYDLEKPIQPPAQTQAKPVPKTDAPDVKLFVMSYCPYGTQMQKAIGPVKGLLGNKSSINIEFVSYVMHGAKEVQENARQYCIMQNNPGKYWSYLSCFLGNQNAAECLANNSLSSTSIDACIADTYSKYQIKESGTSFPVHSEDNTKYGVGGSPTLVINGVQANVARSPEAVKQAICDAFNVAPAECSTKLSASEESPGFGYGTSGGSTGTTAGCGT